jgi:hypothetical protein
METARSKTDAQPAKRASRLRVAIPVVAVVVLVLVGACSWAARGYLSSRHAADQVAARFSEVYGGTVHVDAVDIGTDHSTLQGVRLLEDGGEDLEPWLVVDEVRADLGALALLNDNPTATRVDLRHASVTLRIDESGHLLTRIPRASDRKHALPNLNLTDGTVTFRQAGREAFVVHNVEADLEMDNGAFVLRGRASDPSWGDWSVSGRIDSETGAGETRLETMRVDLTVANLRTIPFVTPNVWDQVQAEGTTPVDFTFRFDPPSASWKYRITIHPENAWVHVNAIDLRADQVAGEVIIEDGTVTLNDLHGRTADGDIRTSADMDFRKRPKEMNFRIGVAGVDIRRLPKTWHIPALPVYRLKGEANLKVMVGGEPKVLTTGGGTGFINNALPVKLVYEGNRPHFTFSGSHP